MKNSKTINSELELIQKFLFQTGGFEISNIKAEPESQKYLAYQFLINGKQAIFRKGKITPTKIGQFVTIWKRNDKGITVPFDINDNIDFFIIATRKDENFGVFIFPKNALLKNRILTTEEKDGKRGIRVYPIWDQAINPQAQKTQLWQTKYFINLSEEKEIDLKRIYKALLQKA